MDIFFLLQGNSTENCVTWSSINVSLHSSVLARSFQFWFPKSTKRLVQRFANKLAALAGLHIGTLHKQPAHVFELITNYIGSQRNWLQCVHMDTNDGLSIPPVLPCHREFIIASAKDQQQNMDKTIFSFHPLSRIKMTLQRLAKIEHFGTISVQFNVFSF